MVEHKYGHTNNTKHVYISNEKQCKIHSRVRKLEDQTQTPRYVSRFKPLLYVPAFTQKDFHYVHTGPFKKEPPLRNYNSTLGVHYSSLKHNHLYIRGIDTKSKQKKITILVIQ